MGLLLSRSLSLSLSQLTWSVALSMTQNDGESPVSFCLHDVNWQSSMRELEAVIRQSRYDISVWMMTFCAPAYTTSALTAVLVMLLLR